MTTELSNSEANMRRLTVQDFIAIITFADENKNTHFYYYQHDKPAIRIKNVILDDIILGVDVMVSCPLIIENSLLNTFVINGCIFQSDFLINKCIFQSDFLINDGTFHNGFRISDNTYRGEFDVNGGIFQGEFLINEGNFEGRFNFNRGIFQRHILIIGGNFQNYFLFFGGTFKEGIIIDGGEFKSSFIVANGDFQGNFEIRYGTFTGDFSVRNGIFHQDFSIKDGIYQGGLTILGGLFYHDFIINGGRFDRYITFQIGIINNLNIYKLNSKIELDIYNTFTLDRLIINATIQKESLIRISNSINYIEFNVSHNFGMIVLNNVSAKTNVINFENHSTLETQAEISNRPQLRIENSDLGKMSLINSDLSGFDLLFKSSKITDLSVLGTQMPKQITTTTAVGKIDFRQQQLGYSQIKKIYEARGDRVEANRYYAREMEAYQQTLSWRGSDFWEKFNLALNKFSTNYGQSWERGFATTLAVSLFFYVIYCCLLGYYPAWPNKISLVNFGNTASYFLEFLNPIHKADYISDQLLTSGGAVEEWALSCARGVESLSRIFITYFVYQLVQAFRKHGKSSG